jgi:hypothetical protein
VDEAEARRLVEAFVLALNGRDSKALSALYADTPYWVCNDLDTLVFNELSESDADLRFARMTESRATLTGGPVVVRLAGGRVVVTFGLEWTFRQQDENEQRTAAFVVEWRVERRAGVLKVTYQRSREVGGEGSC